MTTQNPENLTILQTLLAFAAVWALLTAAVVSIFTVCLALLLPDTRWYTWAVLAVLAIWHDGMKHA